MDGSLNARDRRLPRVVSRPEVAAVLPVLLLATLLAACAPSSGSSGAAGGGSQAASGPATASSGAGSATPRPSRPTVLVASPGAGCPRDVQGATPVHFPSDSGVELGGVILGEGSRGVLLVHGNLATLCEWAPLARVLARDDYEVLAFDMNGFGSSPPSAGGPAQPRYDLDVAAGVRELRSRGATSVVIVGESVSGTAVVVAAADLQPPLDGVVDLSGPAQISGMDSETAAAELRSPVLYMASEGDGDDDGIERVIEATPTNLRQVERVDGNRHGISLLDPYAEPQADRLSTLVRHFIGAHSGG
jgi:predicted alpha/beta-hydrolase family hydrolase